MQQNPPLERVGFEHGDEAERTHLLPYHLPLQFSQHNPTRCTGEIALYLGRSIDSTKRINELRAKGLVDCLYGEKALQCWYPVVKLEA